MKFSLYFLFCLVSSVFAAGSVTLSADHPSWISSGYMTAANTPITITSCTGCTVYFSCNFLTNPANTNFQISDQNGVRITSRSYNDTLFTPLVGTIILSDLSITRDYTVSFRYVAPNDSDFLNVKKGTIVALNINDTRTWTLPGNSGPTGAFITFTALPINYNAPTIAVYPTKTIKAGCEYYLYSGGYPTSASQDRYLIYRYTTGNSAQLATFRYIPNYSATVFVPRNCEIQIAATSYASYPNSATITLNSNPRSGFLMSRNYPGLATMNGNAGELVNLKYQLSNSVSGFDNTDFAVSVNYDLGGATVAPLFQILFDTKTGYAFNGSLTGYSLRKRAKSFSVQFTPGINSLKSNFLIRWDTIKAAGSIHFVMISLFIALFYLQ